jgi:indolepyruvate ferredoxin oxidoreductase
VENAVGCGEEFTRAVALNLAKLMAYKDEYEVARLYTDGKWKRDLARTFVGNYKLKVLLAPPLLAPKDRVTGKPKKIAFGAWMLTGFKLLAGLKGLRGTPWDIFGATEERKMERDLRDKYEADIRRLADELTPASHGLALAIAALPDRIRGYGHIKAAAAAEAAKAEADLWRSYQALKSAPQAVAAE